MKPIKIRGVPFCVDCDDTIIQWNLSKYPDLPRITINYNGPAVVVLNQRNINTVKKFKLLGYPIIIWSRTGADYAEVIARATGLDKIATAYMNKPLFYLDDLPASKWMQRIWRDAQ